METEEFACLHTSGIGSAMHHALTIYAEFRLSRYEGGKTVADPLLTRWYDTRGNKIKNISANEITRDEAKKIDRGYVGILEDLALNHAVRCEW